MIEVPQAHPQDQSTELRLTMFFSLAKKTVNYMHV